MILARLWLLPSNHLVLFFKLLALFCVFFLKKKLGRGCCYKAETEEKEQLCFASFKQLCSLFKAAGFILCFSCFLQALPPPSFKKLGFQSICLIKELERFWRNLTEPGGTEMKTGGVRAGSPGLLEPELLVAHVAPARTGFERAPLSRQQCPCNG